MKPTKYELLEDGGRIILRAFSPEAVQGFWNVEVMRPHVPGRLLPGLRRHAQHLADHWKVPLEDNLAKA
jgi:hypothetical protein